MVKFDIVKGSNECFANERHEGLVCVFVGATGGIGRATLERMLQMLHSSTFYVLGRDPSRYADRLEKWKSTSNRLFFVECQVSLISGIDAACSQIKSAEKRVDYVCMSTGGMPFQGAVYTEEGLETCFSVSYYARLRLVSNLLPLLRKAPSTRVLSILNGSKEKSIDEEDIGLEKKWGIVPVVNHTTMLTSLVFDYLAAENRHITFIHDTPGFVSTDTMRTSYPLMKDGILWWAFLSVMQIVSGWVIKYFGMAQGESGERHAYYLTSETYRPGSWRADRLNELVTDNDSLRVYKQNGWMERAWDHTIRTWDQTLAAAAARQ